MDGAAVQAVAPHLPLTDRITDLLIDMLDYNNGASKAQFQALYYLTAEAHCRAAQGELPTVRRPSRIWDAPAPKQPWYGRDQDLNPLPVVTPKAYRVAGFRVH